MPGPEFAASAGAMGTRKRLWGAGPRDDPLRAVLVSGAVLLSLSALIVWLAWEACGFQDCPDVTLVKDYVPEEGSQILDRNGQELGQFQIEHRELVELEDLPAHVPAAFIAAEDRRFWEHDGVDFRRAIGAALTNLSAGEIKEGSSTITMQLARSIFQEELPTTKRTLGRKLAETRIAVELERRYNKREILELYLNQIYFGSGAWGVETAAKEYFGKPAAELTLGEAALLAGIITAPSRLNPRQDEDAALRARQRVLTDLDQAKLAPPHVVQGALAEEVELADSGLEPGASARYFVEEVRQELDDYFGVALYTHGYRIHTTLDGAAQVAAEEELLHQLDAIDGGRYDPNAQAGAAPDYLQGAVVMLDAENGDVLAMVGGRDFAQSKFNRATQARRQPGSAFKPFVYTAAVKAGMSPARPLEDTPLALKIGGEEWAPQNYDGGFAGIVSMRDALTQSRNVATVRLAQEVGLPAVLETARQLGIETTIPEVPSVAIGAAEVGILELVAAYTPLATLGWRAEPRLVTHVADRHGRVVWETEPQRERVLDPAVAFVVTDMLRDVVERGTGTAARANFSGPAAGKTGTTNDHADVWFVGYTPKRVAGVWIGYDQRRTIARGASGGQLAAPVWSRIMGRIKDPGGDWTPPSGVQRRSVASDDCPEAGEDYFLDETDEVEGCANQGGASAGDPEADSLSEDSPNEDAPNEDTPREPPPAQPDSPLSTDTTTAPPDSSPTPPDTAGQP